MSSNIFLHIVKIEQYEVGLVWILNSKYGVLETH